MSSSSKIQVVLAPALAADRATSMDLYLANIQTALAPHADRFDFEVVTPPSTPNDSWAAKQWNRYIAYPRLLGRRLAAAPGAVLHVLDHSYGHLCRADLPTVLTVHGLENFRLKLPHAWQQALWLYRVNSMRRAQRIVAISTDVADDTRNFIGVPAGKITLNYYGVEPIFTLDGGTTPALMERRNAGELLVLHVGTNLPRKNIGRLLDAIGKLRSEGLPMRFVKVGSDPREEGYREQMEALGLLNHYDYLGWLDAPALAAVYRSCHVLAFPSIHEGFGRPIIEAQACGLPLVVADTASAKEIAGVGALNHAATDTDDLAAKIRAATTEDDTRKRLIKGGFANIRRFSWAEHARALTDIYTEMYSTGTGGASR